MAIEHSPEKMESSKENKISDFSFQDRKQIEEKIDETIELQMPKPALMKKTTFRERKVQQVEELSEKDFAIAMRFTVPFLEEIYDDAIKKTKFRRVLE